MASKLESGPEFETAGVRPPVHKKSHTGFLILVLVVAVALVGGITYELAQRKAEQKTLAASVTQSGEAGPPAVLVGQARLAPGEASVEIPGQTSALVETPLYSRTDGYLKFRNAEIGQRVKKGDLLVELDTPDLDQQIDQARASVAQSRAARAQMQASVVALESTNRFAQLTARRTKALAEQGVFAQQDADDKTAAADTAAANLRAAEETVRAQESVINANDANLRRLLEQKKYARLEAPFDGVITARNLLGSDIGTLITSGSGTNAREIVRISQVQTLRVYVSVPQNYAAMIRPGQVASLRVEELPGQMFPAKVENTSGSLDPGTRTLQTLLMVDNSRSSLLPGMYVKVRFQLPHGVNTVRLPAEALLVRSDGPTAAVVEPGGKVRIQKIMLGRDYGNEIEVTSGLSATDRVILNPGDTLRDGMTVTAQERAAK
ncbi:MAG TPA: efflux RND transporter periplasmic adaptor subunit [Bryobacteraceae bacterium]|nr:efflux RND transporter periplasmic adaptor subunit [Bryobacteraceae bacterium]